jgi:small nuclear ribonucleoprotein (snRNP)-like protein
MNAIPSPSQPIPSPQSQLLLPPPLPGQPRLPRSRAQARALTSLRLLLGSTLRITITDTRVFTGTFVCTDKERNIILANADEWRLATAKPKIREQATAISTGYRGDDTSGGEDNREGKLTEKDGKWAPREEDIPERMDESSDDDSPSPSAAKADAWNYGLLSSRQQPQRISRYVGMIMIPWKWVVDVEAKLEFGDEGDEGFGGEGMYI